MSADPKDTIRFVKAGSVHVAETVYVPVCKDGCPHLGASPALRIDLTEQDCKNFDHHPCGPHRVQAYRAAL